MSAGSPQPLRPPPPESETPAYRKSVLYGGVRFALRHWRRLALFAIVGFAVGAGGSYLFAKRFQANARVALPPTGGQSALGALSAFQSAIGFALPTDNYSPEFITALVTGRNVVDSVLLRPLAAGGGGRSAAEYLGDDDALDGEEFADVRKTFVDRLTASLDVRSGIVYLAFWDTDPVAARAMLQALLDEINRQLISFQRAFALARRDYLAERVAETYRQLSEREAALATFRQTNREISNSPLLQLEADRLNRRVTMALESYRTLQNQLDAAELEVRSDIPQLMVVESPIVPVRKYFPRRSVFALVGAALGLLVAAGLAAARERRRPLSPAAA
jgi:uncharacterized protein involved in exopolysaccharide biosynthesis